MLATAILVFREVLEAALVISIVMAATRGVFGRGLWVTSGAALGVAGAVVMAVFANTIAEAAEGAGQELANAAILFAAAAMLAWHMVWMARHGHGLSRQMQRLGTDVSTGSRPIAALLVVVALAVLREGSEIVLFLIGLGVDGSSASGMMIGGVLGLIGGVAVGTGLYFGLVRIPIRNLFTVTNAMILLLAAGMVSHGARYLIDIDMLPSLGGVLWDSSALISDQSVLGQALYTLIGYDARPTAMQLVFFAATAALIVLGMKAWGTRESDQTTGTER